MGGTKRERGGGETLTIPVGKLSHFGSKETGASNGI